MRLLVSFCSFPQPSTPNRWPLWLLIGSCLLTIGPNNPQVHGLVPMVAATSAVAVCRALYVGLQVSEWVNKMWDLLDGHDSNSSLISINYEQIATHIAESEQQIYLSAEMTVGTLLKDLKMETRLEANLHELVDLMNRISHRESTMRSYLASDEELEQLTMEEFARSTVAQDANSVQGLLARINVLVGGTRDLRFRKHGILEQLGAYEESYSMVCNFGLSAQQVLYQLYNAIAITELKGYSMMQFSWMVLKTYGKGNFTGEAKLMRRNFENRTSRMQSLLQQIMDKSSREYWRCDPDRSKQKEGDTFLQITRLLQGYIVNEVDLNTEQTCKEDCAFYRWGAMQEHCFDYEYCPHQSRCSGKIYGCEYIEADMRACPPSANSARRYEYIAYENGKVLGQMKQCHTTEVESWRRWFYRCSYCFCMCDDAGPRSDRFINLRESVSDVKKNKVVTGLRFVKRKRVIYLIVQQGTLLPRGQIDNTTLEWVEPQAYDVLSKKFVNGRDYNTLMYDNRTMDLDDIVLQPFHVLTGVRFRMLGTHMNLQARMTKMDFGTGKLVDPDLSIWVGNDNIEHRRTELTLDKPHIPILSPSKSDPDSTTNQYIRFRESDRDKDASQTTVPFFDAQQVVPIESTPLGGCGIFHKGQPKYGGFLAPKVFTYDYGPHVHAPQVNGSEQLDSVVEEESVTTTEST